MPDLGRPQVITLLSGAAVTWPLVARAQQPKVYRIGLLETVSVTQNAANYNALRQGLRELGYVEGQNLVIDYRSADGRTGRFPDLATELVRRNVDLMITRGTPAASPPRMRRQRFRSSWQLPAIQSEPISSPASRVLAATSRG